MKKILLISNKVMHYRVSLYNYFHKQFKQAGWELIVRSNCLQKENPHALHFDYAELDFRIKRYTDAVNSINPDVVIIFLHLKDWIIWPLVHWLRYKRIPIIFWTKGINLDAPESKISRYCYKYMHAKFDGIILYSENELKYIHKKHHHKVFIANNTINFKDLPDIKETREQIKQEFNIPFGKVVLSVGRMGADGGRKKIDHLIEVFKDNQDLSVGLVIVGAGLPNDVEQKMNKHNTIYLGEIHDPENIKISKIFKMADVFSIPGHIGLGVNEAFYWGLPVVTEDGKQPPEINYIVNGRNGFIVPENDKQELMRMIMYLIRNDDIRKDYSDKAKQDILRNASVDRMYTGFLNCLEYVKRKFKIS